MQYANFGSPIMGTASVFAWLNRVGCGDRLQLTRLLVCSKWYAHKVFYIMSDIETKDTRNHNTDGGKCAGQATKTSK